MKKILLVEDELHKREELTACVTEFFKGEASLQHVDSVHNAFWAVSVDDFDLIILDMALPTFPTESGHDQALGGVEVLRALKSRGVASKIIIITQYPEITVGGKRLKLRLAAIELSKRYGQEIIGGILYKYRSPSNKNKLTSLLKELR